MAKFYEVAQIRLGKDMEDEDGNKVKGKSWMRFGPTEDKNKNKDVSGLKNLVRELEAVIAGEKQYAALQIETPQEQVDRLKHFTDMSEDDYLYRSSLYKENGPLSFIKRYIKLKVD